LKQQTQITLPQAGAGGNANSIDMPIPLTGARRSANMLDVAGG
jgi:hypothetical protein